MARNHNILYVGIDINNNIKIGMTQQTARARHNSADYKICYYSDAGYGTMTRADLLYAEAYLRRAFKHHYEQVSTDRFIRDDRDTWIHIFMTIIKELKHKEGYPFEEKVTELIPIDEVADRLKWYGYTMTQIVQNW